MGREERKRALNRILRVYYIQWCIWYRMRAFVQQQTCKACKEESWTWDDVLLQVRARVIYPRPSLYSNNSRGRIRRGTCKESVSVCARCITGGYAPGERFDCSAWINANFSSSPRFSSTRTSPSTVAFLSSLANSSIWRAR